MITLESHGTADRETTSLTAWRAAVDEIVCRDVGTTVAEVDSIIGRARLARWYDAGESVALAVMSAASWIRAARPGIRADAEATALRAHFAGVRKRSEN